MKHSVDRYLLTKKRFKRFCPGTTLFSKHFSCQIYPLQSIYKKKESLENHVVVECSSLFFNCDGSLVRSWIEYDMNRSTFFYLSWQRSINGCVLDRPRKPQKLIRYSSIRPQGLLHPHVFYLRSLKVLVWSLLVIVSISWRHYIRV